MTEHVLFFDIDGTMLSTGGAGQRAMELALAEEFRIADPFQQILTAGRTDRGIEDEIFERYSIPATQASRQRFMRLSGSVTPLSAAAAGRVVAGCAGVAAGAESAVGRASEPADGQLL